MATEHMNVTSRHKNTAVASFASLDQVVAVVRALHQAGFATDQISLLAREDSMIRQVTDQVGALNARADEPVDTLADEVEPKGRDELAGMAIGGTVGLLVSFVALAIPGFGGFLLAAGPVAIAIHSLTVSAAGLGLGALLGAIFDERVTEEHRDLYKQKLEAGEWLVVVHGENEEIDRAGELLQGHHTDHLDTF